MLYQEHHFANITMAASATIVLPGDIIPKSALPTGTGKKKTLTLGPGLRHTPPDTVTATVAGALVTDNKKNAASVEYNTGRVRKFFVLFNYSWLTNTFHSTFLSQATSSSRPSMALPPRTSTASSPRTRRLRPFPTWPLRARPRKHGLSFPRTLWYTAASRVPAKIYHQSSPASIPPQARAKDLVS